jgi:hypothetical protein
LFETDLAGHAAFSRAGATPDVIQRPNPVPCDGLDEGFSGQLKAGTDKGGFSVQGNRCVTSAVHERTKWGRKLIARRIMILRISLNKL